MPETSSYPPISDYAFLSDCYSAALVSRGGSVDWLCMPRFDSGSGFGRLLDRERGGFCSISPETDATARRRYLGDSLVLETTLEAGDAVVRILDCLTVREGGREEPYRQLLRVVEGVRGSARMNFLAVPRFDYGEIAPWLRQQGENRYGFIGGNDALLVSSDVEMVPSGKHDLGASFTVRAGERRRFSIEYLRPETLDYDPPGEPGPEELDRRLEETLDWWERWSSRARIGGAKNAEVLRSATVVRGLVYAPTGAIVAAPTTSLPERPGGDLNWDYRYTWIRDSFFSVRSLAEIGFTSEADAFRRFMQRTTAGEAEGLQIMYGVGGERRLTEVDLDDLEGYRGARPVRVGNAASGQLQLDVYGELLELAWLWHRRGNSPDADYWGFLVDLVEDAARLWKEPDHGTWEVRGDGEHFVRSKVMCWVALDRGIRLSKECECPAPVEKWREVRDEIRAVIEREGYDGERGTFVRSFGSKDLDAALLLLPKVGFVDYDDARMVRTADAIREELDDEGLTKRYLGGREGAFIACSFWLAECLARQGRPREARAVFDRAASTGNDLGLFAEEYDTENDEPLGNFPQGLTHLAHISAATALAENGADAR